MVTEFSHIKQQADDFVLSLPPEREPVIRSLAVDYYIDNGLAGTPGAVAVLNEIHGKKEKDLNTMQVSIIKLLRANVFDFLIETGHLGRFEKTLGL